MADTDYLQLQVRGTQFRVARSNLARHPNSRLALLTKTSPAYNASTGTHYLDADPRSLAAILPAYAGECVVFPGNTSAVEAIQQLQFWGLDAARVLDPAARQRFKSELKRAAYLAEVQHDVPEGMRGKIFRFLEMPRSSVLAMLWACLLHTLVFASVMLLTSAATGPLEGSEHVLSDGNSTTYTKRGYRDPIAVRIDRIELPITLIFLAENVLLAVATGFKGEFWSFFNVMAMLGVYPVVFRYLLLFVMLFIDVNLSAVLLHCCALFRMFRFIKALRAFLFVRILLCALVASWRQLIAWSLCILVAMVFLAHLFFFAEHLSDYGQAASPLDGLWWAVATVTTVGYGDIFPVTRLGKMVATAGMYLGVVSIAVTAAIVTSHLLDATKFARDLGLAEGLDGKAVSQQMQGYVKALKTEKPVLQAETAKHLL